MLLGCLLAYVKLAIGRRDRVVMRLGWGTLALLPCCPKFAPLTDVPRLSGRSSGFVDDAPEPLADANLATAAGTRRRFGRMDFS